MINPKIFCKSGPVFLLVSIVQALVKFLSHLHSGTTRKQTQNHCYGDNRKMAAGFTYRI